MGAGAKERRSLRGITIAEIPGILGSDGPTPIVPEIGPRCAEQNRRRAILRNPLRLGTSASSLWSVPRPDIL